MGGCPSAQAPPSASSGPRHTTRALPRPWGTQSGGVGGAAQGQSRTGGGGGDRPGLATGSGRVPRGCPGGWLLWAGYGGGQSPGSQASDQSRWNWRLIRQARCLCGRGRDNDALTWTLPLYGSHGAQRERTPALGESAGGRDAEESRPRGESAQACRLPGGVNRGLVSRTREVILLPFALSRPPRPGAARAPGWVQSPRAQDAPVPELPLLTPSCPAQGLRLALLPAYTGTRGLQPPGPCGERWRCPRRRGRCGLSEDE